MAATNESPVEIDRALEGLNLSTSVLEQVQSLLPQLLPQGPQNGSTPFGEALDRLDKAVETLRTQIAGPMAEPVEPTTVPGTQPCDTREARAVLSGFHPPVSLQTLLGFLSLLMKTGVLLVRADGCLFTITIVEGDVVHGLSEPRPESELLGQILIHSGAIDAATLDSFIERHKGSGRLGEALEQEELVSYQALDNALNEQLKRLFDRLFAASKACFSFHEVPVPPSEVQMRMNVTRLLLQSAVAEDETRRDRRRFPRESE